MHCRHARRRLSWRQYADKNARNTQTLSRQHADKNARITQTLSRQHADKNAGITSRTNCLRLCMVSDVDWMHKDDWPIIWIKAKRESALLHTIGHAFINITTYDRPSWIRLATHLSALITKLRRVHYCIRLATHSYQLYGNSILHVCSRTPLISAARLRHMEHANK